VPNLDPHIKPFEVLEKNEERVVVRTGFECVIRKQFADPMPAYLSWDTQTVEQIAAFQFDDPWDERRYEKAGDDQINCAGDTYARNIPAFVDRVRARVDDIPVFGSVAEGQEMLWRIIGMKNALELMALEPDVIARFVERIGEFSYQAGLAQIKAAGGMLSGMYIWGDVAYRRGMFFSPAYWRKVFKPVVRRLCELFHSHNLPVIYHGCGNATAILDDLIEAGIDGYNPLEAKAGLDVIDLRRKLGHRLCFAGNLDVTVWAHNDRREVREALLRKLNAAKGGGFIPQSDHSVPSNVSGETYDDIVELVRKHGRYPLQLGGYDIPDIG
jgi:uroporphyrinogen-III decarboxylase